MTRTRTVLLVLCGILPFYSYAQKDSSSGKPATTAAPFKGTIYFTMVLKQTNHPSRPLDSSKSDPEMSEYVANMRFTADGAGKFVLDSLTSNYDHLLGGGVKYYTALLDTTAQVMTQWKLHEEDSTLDSTSSSIPPSIISLDEKIVNYGVYKLEVDVLTPKEYKERMAEVDKYMFASLPNGVRYQGPGAKEYSGKTERWKAEVNTPLGIVIDLELINGQAGISWSQLMDIWRSVPTNNQNAFSSSIVPIALWWLRENLQDSFLNASPLHATFTMDHTYQITTDEILPLATGEIILKYDIGIVNPRVFTPQYPINSSKVILANEPTEEPEIEKKNYMEVDSKAKKTRNKKKGSTKNTKKSNSSTSKKVKPTKK